MGLEVRISDKWSDGDKVRDFGHVLQVVYNNEIILEEADTMEPEDATFLRDLSWVRKIIEAAYRLGVKDGQ